MVRALFCLLLALVPVRAQTVTEFPSLEWLVASSDVIVVASVAKVERELFDAKYPQGAQRIAVTLDISETLKGKPPSPLKIAYAAFNARPEHEVMQTVGGPYLWFLEKNSNYGKKFKDEEEWPGEDPRFRLRPVPHGWDHIGLGELPKDVAIPRQALPVFRMTMEVVVDSSQALAIVRDEVKRKPRGKEPYAAALPFELTRWAGLAGSGIDLLLLPDDPQRLEAVAREWIEHPDRILEKPVMGGVRPERMRELLREQGEKLRAALKK